MCVCVCECMCVYVCVCTCEYVCMCTCMYAYVHECVYIVSVCACACECLSEHDNVKKLYTPQTFQSWFYLHVSVTS